ncbi:MAG: serine hydrolase domain-containing protein [Frankiaceae bacterium]
MQALTLVDGWPVGSVAVAVVLADGTVAGRRGDAAAPFPLASVTKLLSAYAALVAVEEGAIELDEPAGPPGSTVAHLLAHASGLASSENRVKARPGARRIYSNAGFDLLGEHVAARTGIPFAAYLTEAVLEPLGMGASRFAGSPASDAVSTVDDLVLFARELHRPRLLDASTHRLATTVAFPGLPGVLPGFGRMPRNDWGLGFEVRDGKAPHWTGRTSSPATFGHFGQTGTFLWVDPVAGAACICLTDRTFAQWAVDAWPPLTDAILAELAAGAA